ncbi:MAG TPA: radical SAM protein [Candidatus Nanoarchaeia archaeon]|nr:radical SAM protein [Candidatus Nanoarchaeia archaeon]
MDPEIAALVQQAGQIYKEHFPLTTGFERAIFFSWGCTIGDCTFCYMSTQPVDKKPVETKRTVESILAEFILAKKLGWEIGFFTGGIGVFTPREIKDLLEKIYAITQEKIWLSIGPIAKPLLQEFLPYIKGVVGSTETINPVLHKLVCPSKPLAPYERMFVAAKELGLARAMTFIVGMGETREDFQLLKTFIEKYDIDKIHVYGLIPQEGTMFAASLPPTEEEQAWWIAKLRIAFPPLDIQCGIWEDRVGRVSLLLQAGANSISKFKATKLFGTSLAQEIEDQAGQAGRTFVGTLTRLPDIDWDGEIEKLPFSSELKEKVRKKLWLYLQKMQRNSQNSQNSPQREKFLAQTI